VNKADLLDPASKMLTPGRAVFLTYLMVGNTSDAAYCMRWGKSGGCSQFEKRLQCCSDMGKSCRSNFPSLQSATVKSAFSTRYHSENIRQNAVSRAGIFVQSDVFRDPGLS